MFKRLFCFFVIFLFFVSCITSKKAPNITNRTLIISAKPEQNLRWENVGCNEPVRTGCFTNFELEIIYDYEKKSGGAVEEKFKISTSPDFSCPVTGIETTPSEIVFYEPFRDSKIKKKVAVTLSFPCDCPGGTITVAVEHTQHKEYPNNVTDTLVKSNELSFIVPPCP